MAKRKERGRVEGKKEEQEEGGSWTTRACADGL
jgi:hypothetical protein